MKGIIKSNLFMAFVLLFTFFNIAFAARDIIGLIGYDNYKVFAQYIIFLIPVIIYLIITRESPKKVFSINKISFVDIMLSIVIAFLAHPVAGFFSQLTGLFFENPVEQALEVLQSTPFPMLLFMMAITPSICEEAVTRGIFLHGYKKTNMLVACLANGVVFSMLHLDLQQSLYTFVLGVIFAFMVRVTNSIWSSVLCHFTFNSISLGAQQLLKMLPKEEVEAALEASAQTGNEMTALFSSFIIAIPFAIAIVVILTVMYKRNKKRGKLEVQVGEIDHSSSEVAVKDNKVGAYSSFAVILIVYTVIIVKIMA